jgi:hypothetical protein
MRKQLAIIGIISLLVCVGLSGCVLENKTQSSNLYGPQPTTDIQLLNYTVITTWENKEYTKKYVEPGFYHHIPENASTLSLAYVINGTVKNNVGRLVNSVYVNIIFYDANNNELGLTQSIVPYLPNTYTGAFSATYVNSTYFDKIDHVSFTFLIN